MSKTYDALFTPFTIGKLQIKNRVVMGPMGGTRLIENSKFMQKAANYLMDCAKGGAGLIITGVTYVQDTKGYNTPLWKDADIFVPNARKVTDAIHGENCRIFLQLGSGRGRTLVSDGNLPGPEGPTIFENALIAPSELPNVWKPEVMHRAMTIDEIHTLVDNFGKSAKMAQEAGFDGVEIHAIHEGYLLDQFTVACTNHRTDEYGGSLENRMRLPREIIEAVRRECGPDFPVMVRYSVTSKMKGFNSGALPGEPYTEFGRSLEESPKVARMLQEMGYDALDADNGSYDSWYWAHPPVYMPKACNLPEVSYIKHFVDIPVLCGGRVGYPDVALSIVEKGQADAIVAARPFLSDPDWVRKMEQGRAEDIRPCISCHNACLSRRYGEPLRCAVNATAMMGGTNDLKPGEGNKKVLIIGGGIGGMEAARVCALRGYHPILLERSGQLGGVFRAAAAPRSKDVNRDLIRWYERQMEQLGVEVRLHTEGTSSIALAEQPDVIIIATGGHPIAPKLPGIPGNNVMQAADFLLNPQLEHQRYVVVGAGLTGCELSYELGEQGKQVTLLEMQPDYLTGFPELFSANVTMLRDLLAYHKVDVRTSTKLVEVREGAVVIEQDGVRSELPADMVILSIGFTSRPEGAAKYEGIAPVWVVGDAAHVSNVKGPIWGAYEVANKI